MIFADNDGIKPVRVRRLRPDPFALHILQTLEDNDFAQALLYGGALRDRYMGAEARIEDYDIWAQFGNSAAGRPVHERSARWFAHQVLTLFPGAALSEEPSLEHTTSRTQSWARIKFTWQGKQIDLLLTTLPCPLEEKALMADAPINAVAMDARGRIKAHPEFEDHARRKIYAPLPFIEKDMAAARFDHLRSRIAGLKPPGCTVTPLRPPQP
jgi:hypothetical protein